MTTGEKLISSLHLEKYPNAYIGKGLSSGSKSMYFIFFNSRYPNASINHSKILRQQKVDIFSGNKLDKGIVRRIEYFPFEKLSDFNSGINTSYIVLYDLCDINHSLRYDYNESINRVDLYKDIVSGYNELCYDIYKLNNKLEESNFKKYEVYNSDLVEMTIPELQKANDFTSAMTKNFRDIRKKVQGSANTNTKFVKTEYFSDTGSLRYTFLTEATEEQDKNKTNHKHKKQKKHSYDYATDKLIDNPSGLYTIEIQLENIVPNEHYSDISWLEVYSGEVLNQKLLSELLVVADVLIYDDDPSFQFQGMRYRCTLAGVALRTESRPDTVWRQKHGDLSYLPKHMSQLFLGMSFFIPQMTSATFNVLKEEGFVNPKTRIVEV